MPKMQDLWYNIEKSVKGGLSMSVAIITGASSGLGWEFVRQLNAQFPHITECWAIARRTDRLAAYSVPGLTIRPIPLDLTSEDYVNHLNAMLEAEKPEVSLLINNAGCGYLGNFDESDLNQQHRMTDLNIRALTAVTRAVLPYMPSGSHIINVSSIASFVPNARMTVYSATKAFVTFFSRGLDLELKPRQISVTAVCPGPMATEFITLGNIKGHSKTFDLLPYCKPDKVAKGALKAAGKCRPVYTPTLFYKFYRILAKLLPQALLIHAAKT